jgi:hypothetical protein
MADGLRLSFNLGDLQGGVDLMQVRFDGSGLAKLCQTKGSGHPSENPKRPGLLVTDQYSWEKGACGDGSIYIRLIDLASDSERRLLRIDTCTPYEKDEACLRVDPHVVWDRTGRFAVFNAFDGGTRRIYLSDLRAFVS